MIIMTNRNRRKAWETNRILGRRIRSKWKSWCSGCDAYLNGAWGKCPRCGHIYNKRKLKNY